jgi:predicted nuclease of restriction endonuclease-like (RecB) superfamily
MHVIFSHWEIGKLLEERKLDSKHGDQIVKRLSVDLKDRYPNMGLSPRNLWDMKRFYLRYYQEDTKLRQAVAVLPWGHNLLLLNSDLLSEHILFYANEVISKSWSRNMLNLALKSEYHLSIQASEKSNNFSITMSEENAEYANEIFRSHYHLGFIDAIEPLKELDLERHLVNKITSFIMELGNGFSFIGNQHTLSYNNKEYHVDLLFFHRKLRSMIAIELKIGEFKPEYIGKMNFYLSLLDKLEKAPDENPSIGIILCAGKDHLEVELALQDVNKPIGVAEFQYLLPQNKLEAMLTNEIKKRSEK